MLITNLTTPKTLGNNQTILIHPFDTAMPPLGTDTHLQHIMVDEMSSLCTVKAYIDTAQKLGPDPTSWIEPHTTVGFTIVISSEGHGY